MAVKILYGTETGNSEELAKQACETLKKAVSKVKLLIWEIFL